MARTDTLGNFLTDVADAIRTKKGTSEAIQASDFDTEIENLPSGGDLSEYFNTEVTKNYYTPTSFIKKLPTITITSNVTTVQSLFNNCSQLQNVKVVAPVGNSVTNMSYMFSSCSALTEVDLSEFDTSNVTNMSSMFMYCKGFRALDLSTVVTPKVTDMSNMFEYTDRKMTKLDIRNFTFDSVTNYNNMFGSAMQGIKDACLIIVKSQAEKDWINMNFSRLENVKTVAEYEAK